MSPAVTSASAQALQAGLASVIAQYNAGQRGAAEQACNALMARHGPHPALQQMLAVLCQERGDAAAARLHIEASLAARPDHAPSLFIQSLICQDLNDLPAAEAALQRVLALQPQHPAAALNLGIVQLQQGRREAALQLLGRAWQQRPGSFGRIAMALCSEPCGSLWLDAEALKRDLQAAAASAAG